MKGHGEKLTRKQELAIAALLAEPTVGSAAKKVGVGEVTLWRWLRREDFTTAYRAARRQVVEKAVAQLQNASWTASATLLKLLEADSEGVRLRAAIAILDHAHKAVELLDIEERLSALEARTAQTTNGERSVWHYSGD